MNVKNILLWLSCFAMLFLVGACSEDDVKVAPEGEHTLTVSTESLSFTAEAGEQIVTFETDAPEKTTKNLNVTGWCSATLDRDTKQVTVSVTANTSKKTRTCVLYIITGTVIKQVAITQAPPIEGVYKVNLPGNAAAFSASKIYRVMDGNTELAEICLEYLNSGNVQQRAVVVYLGGDYTNGLVAYLVDASGNPAGTTNGGTATFNKADNTLAYTPGTSAAITAVYISESGISKDVQAGAADKAAEPYTVKDASGNMYPVVKIGTDIWLGSNLRTTKFGNGTAIDCIRKASIPEYYNATPFVMYPGDDAEVDVVTFGYLYSPKAVNGANGLSLEQSIIDGNNHWRITTLPGFAPGQPLPTPPVPIMDIEGDWPRLFKYVGPNQLGTLCVSNTDWWGAAPGYDPDNDNNNLTGLSIYPAGEFYGLNGTGPFQIGYKSMAMFVCNVNPDINATGYNALNLAEGTATTSDEAGVRKIGKNNEASAVRLVRVDE
jgi:hypothetical protein